MDKREILARRLRQVARDRTTISYQKAAQTIGKAPNRIAKILDEISRLEHEEDRPMLPAVVVVADRGVPGDGFFTCAKDLGRSEAPQPNETTSIPVQRAFWEKELDKVYRCWAQE